MFSISDRPIDIEDAVVVLNHFRHDQRDDWYMRDGQVEQGNNSYVHLTEFEAVAIAGKYLRDHVIKFRFVSSERTHSDSNANVCAIWQVKIVT